MVNNEIASDLKKPYPDLLDADTVCRSGVHTSKNILHDVLSVVVGRDAPAYKPKELVMKRRPHGLRVARYLFAHDGFRPSIVADAT